MTKLPEHASDLRGHLLTLRDFVAHELEIRSFGRTYSSENSDYVAEAQSAFDAVVAALKIVGSVNNGNEALRTGDPAP